jgi:hypothetical protein
VIRINRLTLALAAVLLAALLTPLTAAAAPRWGAFKRDGCVAVNKRQYSAQLWGIQGDWNRACITAGASINGQKFRRPARCKNMGAGGMWGEFDVHDSTCHARWGPVKRDACVRLGVRQYSARLFDIPGRNWRQACSGQALSLGAGRSQLPTRCKDLGVGGMWGEFEVPDESCPYWGNEAGKAGTVRGECVAIDVRKHYARLWDMPAGADWGQACRTEAQRVAGHATPRPSSCVWKGPLGMWGEWLVRDTSCTAASFGQDARRRMLATRKLGELGDVIASKLDFAFRVARDPQVKASLQVGDERQIARAVNPSSAAWGAGPDGYLLRTVTVGLTVGAKFLVVGGQAEAGAAIDLKGKRPVYAYGAAGYDFGPGLAGGGGVNVGFWVCQNNKIGGDIWGLQFGVDDLVKLAAKKPSLDKGASLTVGLWFNAENVFQGFTITPGVGAGAHFGGLVYASTAVDGDETVQCDGRAK